LAAFLASALIIVGVALYVALPLWGGLFGRRARRADSGGHERLEHERALAVQALRDLEFDREMGKLGDRDYQTLQERLEGRALDAMTALEKLGEEGRRRAPARVTALAQRTPRRVDAPVAPGSGRISFCPSCGARIAAGANFCAECGMGLRPLGRATGWSD